MELIEVLKDIGAKNEFVKSGNYYYERHICSDGEEKKVMMDYTLSSDTTDKILRFGVCEDCGRVFYHNDFSSKSF